MVEGKENYWCRLVMQRLGVILFYSALYWIKLELPGYFPSFPCAP